MYEVIFDRNSAKAYVKNLRVLSRRKSAKRGFMKSSSHFSTASGGVPQSIQTMYAASKGLEARDFSTFTFSHWANR
jgi:hypothetical protein